MAAVTTTALDEHLFIGDSTNNGDSSPATSWWAGTGYFADQLTALAAAQPARYRGSVRTSGAKARVVSAVKARQNRASPIFKNAAISGSKVVDVTSSVISAKGGHVVWLLVGVNDVVTGTTLGTFSAQYTATLATVRSVLPNSRIMCVQIICHGEVWNTGPVWNNADDATMASFNAAIATAATTVTPNAIVVPFRDLLLQWEVTNNPGKGSAVFTSDGIHPNNVGRAAAPSFVLPYVTMT